MKKTVCLVLALMLLFTAASAVAGSQLNGSKVITRHEFGANGLTTLPIVDEPLTIDVWKGLNSPVMESWDQCIVYGELEARTGVHINWIYPPVGSETDNFNLLVASEDLPHMFSGANMNYRGSLDEMCENEVFLELNSYYDNGMLPNYKYLRDTYEDISKDTVLDSGRLAAFYQFDYVGSAPWSGFWYREDLFNQYGLKEPVTVDDWTNALKTLNEAAGYQMIIQVGTNGGGSANLSYNHFFFSTYDTSYTYYQVDGKVKYGAMEDGFADALALLAGWYANGWIDKDFPTYDWNGYLAKIADPANYCILGMNYSEIGQTIKTASLAEPNYSIKPINSPVVTEGQQLHLRQTDFLVRGWSDAITWRCLDEGIAEDVCRWKDYWYSQDGADLLSYGVEGVSYEWNENNELEWIYDQPDKAEYFPVDMTDPVMDFWTVYPLFKLHNGAYLRDSSAYFMDDKVWECIAKWGEVDNSYILPSTSFTPEEAKDFAALNTPIQDYLNECVGKVITGQMDVAEWPSVQEHMKDMGIEDCLAYRQAAYDRYLAR